MNVLPRSLTLAMRATVLAVTVLLAACGSTTAPTGNLTTSHNIFAVSTMRWTANQAQWLKSTITSINPQSGTVSWTHQQDLNPFHRFELPTQLNGVLYLPTDGVLNIKDTSGIPPAGSIMALRASDGKTLWNTTVGVLPATPIISNNVVYTIALDATKNAHKWIYALNAGDGQQLWRTDITTISAFANYLQLVDGVLYLRSNTFCFDSCSTAYLLAVRASDGKVLWHLAFDGGISLDPVIIANGLLYMSIPKRYQADNSTIPEQLVALSLQDGHQVWSIQGLYSQELVAQKGVLYGTLTLGDVNSTAGPAFEVALDGQSGKQLWRVPTDVTSTLRLVDATSLYVSSDPRDEVHHTDQNYLMALRLSDGSRQWQVPIGGNFGIQAGDNKTLYGSAIIYTSNAQGQVSKTTVIAFALDANTGKNHWSMPFTGSSTNPSVIGGILAVIGNVCYLNIQNSDGSTLMALNAQTGTLLWQANISGTISGVTATP